MAAPIGALVVKIQTLGRASFAVYKFAVIAPYFSLNYAAFLCKIV
jgi:hypothetical protein